MRSYGQFGIFFVMLASFSYVNGQTVPSRTFSITNSTASRVTFSLSTGKQQWTETLDAYFTRQYTTSESYRITLSTANRPPVQFNLSAPNKYTIQWDSGQRQWIIVTSGRFY